MAFLQSSLNQGTFGSLLQEICVFGVVSFSTSTRRSVNLLVGSSADITVSSVIRDRHKARKDSQSALLKFLLSVEGSSSSAMLVRMTG